MKKARTKAQKAQEADIIDRAIRKFQYKQQLLEAKALSRELNNLFR